MIVAELVDSCQLKCALCPNRFMAKSHKQMPLSIVEKILEKHGKNWIDWFNWGEPLLHKDFVEVAKMIQGRPSRISSNLSLPLTDEHFEAMSKFRTVLVSLSGIVKETYQIYHQGGNFDLVKSNFERLVSVMEKKKKFPLFKSIIVNFLSHKYNVEEGKIFKEYCERLGVRFNPQLLVCTVEEQIAGFEHELLMTPRFQSTGRKECRILDWDTIGVDGEYLLCCSSQNIKIGLTIDDDVSHEEIVKAKLNTNVCKACYAKELWRMYS